MDTLIYLGTGVITIAWSVWAYLSWSDHARLPETSSLRFLLIVGPSGYFLLIALAGWGRALYLRLDLIGIVVLDCLTLICWFYLLLTHWVRVKHFRRGYVTVLALYNAAALSLVVLAHLIKIFPPLLIRFTNLIQQGSELDFFRFAWIGLDPESHQGDLLAMLNRVLIALLSYIPISILRTLYVSRQFKRRQRSMALEIGSLKAKIQEIERRIEQGSVAKAPQGTVGALPGAPEIEAGETPQTLRKKQDSGEEVP